MNRQEFVDRTNMVVTEEQYLEIEKVYMMTGTDKDPFCQMWVGASDECRKYMIEMTKSYHDDCNRIGEELKKAQGKIESLQGAMYKSTQRMSDPDLREKLIASMGEREYLVKKIQNGDQMWELDNQLLVKLLSMPF